MENQRPQDLEPQDLPEQEIPAEVPAQEAAGDNLDLESIIQEFRDLSDENLPDPELPAEMLPHEPEPEPAPVSGDTIRMDLSQLPKGSYNGAQPIEDEPEPVEEEVTEELEPFSDQWEPEYEQPMGEYVPPQPILFHPQSRLRELKKKLVAGPEKRYYQLMEKGTGKLQVLIVIGLILSLLCIGSTVLDHLEMVQENRLKLMIFGQMLFMFVAALLGSFQLVEGLADLIRLRFSLNTLLLFSFLVCAVDGLFCLQQLRVPCCAPFTLQVVFSLFDTLHRRRTEMSQMDTLRKATNLTAVRQAKDQSEKVLVRSAGQVEDFMDSYDQVSKPAKIRSWYVIGALIASLGVGVTGAVLYDITTGLKIAAVTLLASAPATFFVSLSRPADILEKRFHKLGTLICGWKGVNAACGKATFPIGHTDLFPGGTVKMNGVKFFGSRNPDEVVAYGTALILSDKNGLAPLFEQVLESRNCHHLTAQDVTCLDGGITGLVRGEPVMVGSLSFLQSQGVEIPEGLRVSNAVCVAVDGILSGLFAINYDKTRAAASGLHTLTAYRKLKPVIADGDFLITPGFLRSKFGVHSKRLQFADPQLRAQLAAMEPDLEAPASVLTTQQTLAAAAYGVTGARALRKASYLGLAIHIAGGIIGIGIMLTLTVIGALHLLTPMHVMLYQLIWCLPGFLATEWSRLI